MESRTAKNPDSRTTRSAQVAVIGSGYVGLTTAACLAHLGHRVRCTDVVESRVAALAAAQVPIVEAGLEHLVAAGIAAERLTFGTDNISTAQRSDFVFLCVPTPQGADGRADMSYVVAAAREIGPFLRPEAIVINKSTVPVGSTEVVQDALDRGDVTVVSNPEFLREGTAVSDFLQPDRVVIGATNDRAAQRVASLYESLDTRIVITDPASAEIVKYASNAFLATKVSFINEIAALCELVGADVREVAMAVGADHRIGNEFLRPGPGWGGSCFPKDTAALVRIADDAGLGFKLLRSVITANEEQYERVACKALELCGDQRDDRRIALWGLTFKAGTDDLRSSPALEIARRLTAAGVIVQAYDPTVHASIGPDGIEMYDDPVAACNNASVVVVATEWPALREVDLHAVGAGMAQRAMVDARNLFDPADVCDAGFVYTSIGRASSDPSRDAGLVGREVV